MTDPKSPLMTALHFTADDLAANRRGVMSEHQRNRLRQSRRKDNRSFAATLILTLAVILVVGIAVQAVGLAVVLAAGTGTLMGAVFYQGGKGLAEDLSSGQVTVVEGTDQTTTVTSHRDHTRYYDVTVGDQRFRVGRQAYTLLKVGGRYRAYYTPRSKTLLSLEPLNDPSQVTEAPL